MNKSTLFSSLKAITLGGILCLGLGTAPSYAVDELGLFSLDGNPLDDNAYNTLPDDWETLCDPVNDPTVTPGGPCQNSGFDPSSPPSAKTGFAEAFTGIVNDPNNTTIFTGGGSKDIYDVAPSWLHKNGSVSQKSDLTDAFAAAYVNPTDQGIHKKDDLIIYFGADRLDHNGDTFMGFWFFQNEITLNAVPPTGPGGTFNGVHKIGDVLVLMNFPQANNAVPEIKVLKWVGDDKTTGCTKAANNDPQAGQCAAANLLLIGGGSGSGPAGAVCSDSGGTMDQPACAITNLKDTANEHVASPWPYTSAEGDVNNFPYETFFSGGINISYYFPEFTGCFSSFMAETRSSSSYTASLEDFVLDDFKLCSSKSETKIYKDLTNNGPSGDDVQVPHLTNPVGDVVVGDYVYDTVEVSGNAIGQTLTTDPTGKVLFKLFKSSDCTGTALNNSGAGDLVTIISDGVADGVAHAYTSSIQIMATGAYSWLAVYQGDTNFPGSTAACEPFNSIQPKLTLRKEILSCANDGGTFAVSVDGTTAFNANLGDPTVALLTDGNKKGPLGVTPGSYTARETLQDAYVTIIDNTATGGDCTAGGTGVQTITLGGSDNKTCVFVNIRKPKVTVKKTLVNAPLGTAFDLWVGTTKVADGSVPQTQGSTLISNYTSPSNFGAPVVKETLYGATDTYQYSTVIQCDDGNSATFDIGYSGDRKVTLSTLATGDHVTCEITNIYPTGAKACLSSE